MPSTDMRRAQRAPLEVAQDHPRGGIEQCRRARVRSVSVRRKTGGASGRIASAGGSRKARCSPLGCRVAAASEREAEGQRRPRDGCSVQSRYGKAVEVHVDVRHRPRPSQAPSASPGRTPTPTISKHQLRVVQADLEAAVAEGLQHRDLLALRRHQAPITTFSRKRRHAEEDRREQPRHDLQLVELLVEEPVRELQVAAVGADAAVAREQRVERVDDVVLARLAASA